MHTIKEDTTLVGVSELRTRLEKILEEAKRHKVVIEKRNKPVAVLIAIERYNAIEELLDRIEDYINNPAITPDITCKIHNKVHPLVY